MVILVIKGGVGDFINFEVKTSYAVKFKILEWEDIFFL